MEAISEVFLIANCCYSFHNTIPLNSVSNKCICFQSFFFLHSILVYCHRITYGYLIVCHPPRSLSFWFYCQNSFHRFLDYFHSSLRSLRCCFQKTYWKDLRRSPFLLFLILMSLYGSKRQEPTLGSKVYCSFQI